MDSAFEGKGLCMSYVGVGVWSVLLSYFCNSVAFWACPKLAHKLAHRSVGFVHFDWGKLDFGFQPTGCGSVWAWVCCMCFSLHLLGPAAIQSLLFKSQMAGMQDNKWKQVTSLQFLTPAPTIHLQVAGRSSAECSRTGCIEWSCV